MKKNKGKKMKAEDFDRAFDEGKDVTKYLDLKSAKVKQPIQRINIDMPQEILDKVDQEADRIGVPRTSLIKLWIAERLDRMAG